METAKPAPSPALRRRQPPPPLSLIALAATILASIGFAILVWVTYANRQTILQFLTTFL